MKKALIFGVTGQDGSFLSELLLEKGYYVIGVKRRSSSSNTDRLSGVLANDNFELVDGDVTDAFSVHRILQHYWPNEVYNLAAQSHVKLSFDEPQHTWKVVAEGCLNILESIRTIINDQLTTEGYFRFYQASSSEMFGSMCSMEMDDDTIANIDFVDINAKYYNAFQNENTPFAPNSPYAIAKLAAHNMVRLYRNSYGLHASSGILFNHESPKRGDNFVTRKISKYVANFANVRTVKKHTFADVEYFSYDVPLLQKLELGNLLAKRDWGHAKDYVNAMWLMLQQERADDYVIGTGETHTVEEFLKEAFLCIGIDNYTDYVIINKNLYRPSEVSYLRADSGKAQQVLGWKPTVTFKQLVKDMVESDKACL